MKTVGQRLWSRRARTATAPSRSLRQGRANEPGSRSTTLTQYLEKLIREGRLAAERAVDLKVTYHDRAIWAAWVSRGSTGRQGVQAKRACTFGCIDPRRSTGGGPTGSMTRQEHHQDVPGVESSDVSHREYAWCCGAGGGVIDSYPDFAGGPAPRAQRGQGRRRRGDCQRLPWCKRNFLNAAEGPGTRSILDIIELVQNRF